MKTAKLKLKNITPWFALMTPHTFDEQIPS